jgi:hypothetical protein
LVGFTEGEEARESGDGKFGARAVLESVEELGDGGLISSSSKEAPTFF